jgi:hypothetical protein
VSFRTADGFRHRSDEGSLPKTQRSQHIQACVRREMASQLEQLQSDIHYCHECFQWVVGDRWEEHCQSHLQSITSKVCGTVIYIHTLVRPAFCPFCLGNKAASATRRLESWTRDHHLWGHMNEHLVERCWPCHCPHPLCDVSLEDEAALRFHFVDDHGISGTRPSGAAPSNSTGARQQELPLNADRHTTGATRKRKSSRQDGALEWLSPENFPKTSNSGECLSPPHTPKRMRTTSRTTCPSLISKVEDAADTHPLESNVHTITQSTMCDLEIIDCGTIARDRKSETPLLHWTPDLPPSVPLDEASAVHYSSDETIFSQYLRSPSPCSSFEELGEHSGEHGGEHGSELRSTDVDVSAVSPSSPTTTLGLDEDMCDGREKTHATKDGLRIRLRVNPPAPRIMLHLRRPKLVTITPRKGKQT